jgi:hypothetical protein
MLHVGNRLRVVGVRHDMIGPRLGGTLRVLTLGIIMCVSVPACGQNTASPSTTATKHTTPPNSTTAQHLSGRATGVWGRATAGPTCPVERVNHPCPPRPVSATIQVLDPNERIITTTQSDSHGWYAIRLPRGEYVLHVASTNTLPRCLDTHVTVGAPPPIRTDIGCDTGIR